MTTTASQNLLVSSCRGETRPRRRRRKALRQQPEASYSITDGNDCMILGHTLNHFDLAGCTTCISCGVTIYCPKCIHSHPHDPQAVPVFCGRHEESTVNA